VSSDYVRTEIGRIRRLICVSGAATRRGARSCNDGARDRAVQGQPATNVPRRCQGFRAGPAARISASPPRSARAIRCRHFRPRKPQQLPRCRQPLHLLITCRGNLNRNRKSWLSRRPSQSCYRCRGRRCLCTSTGSFTLQSSRMFKMRRLKSEKATSRQSARRRYSNDCKSWKRKAARA